MSGSTRVPCQCNKVKMVQCLLPFVASTHFSHLGDVDFKPLRIFMKLKLMSSTAYQEQDNYQILGTGTKHLDISYIQAYD